MSFLSFHLLYLFLFYFSPVFDIYREVMEPLAMTMAGYSTPHIGTGIVVVQAIVALYPDEPV